MRQKVIAGNWKMYKTIPEALRLVNQLRKKLEAQPPRRTRVIVCPPFTALAPVHEALQGSNIGLGAQNIFWEEEGAYTGEISAAMVKSTGAKYVIIGHSERRRYFHEEEAIINKKIKIALKNKLKVIHCIGESLEEREQGLTMEVVSNQVEWDLKDLTPQDLKNIIIAYEPVWAIGTGKTATPEQAEEVHSFLRDILDALFDKGAGKGMTILYGGSVKPENAASLLSQPDIDGALVGGACLKADSFFKIIQASEKVG
ncbi:MAG: triose-phosphate isomerase [Calditrichaeota bacterium]|nr:MAG: triose-phosphate isomerase [Calditrichota bacterium]